MTRNPSPTLRWMLVYWALCAATPLVMLWGIG